MGFVGRKPTNAPLTSSDLGTGIVGSINIADGSITSSDLAPGAGGIAWQSVQTTGFTAVTGRGYPCNTTSAAFTVTLPASPSVGDQVLLLDYAGTFATNNITLGANSNKIEGATANKILTTNREAITLTYVDATQGWVASSGANEGTQSIDPTTYSADFLVIAGGGGGGGGQDDGYGGGGGGAGGYRNSYSTETSGGAEGGGSAGSANHGVGRAGGSGVIILRMLTAKYSGTTTGSPTVSTSGSDTILVYNASGSYTA